MTEDGRPKPMQVKRVGKETRVVVLPEEVYPEIWTGLENLTRMTTERQAIETELRLLRESLVATGR